MKGFIAKTAAGCCLCASLTALAGCLQYRQLVDPCWPARYNQMARDSVRSLAFVQTEKGHILDQTVWNWMFECDPKNGLPTDHLNGAGIEHLKYISRRLPVPDCHVYLQNAQDILYEDGLAPERMVEIRGDLNTRRIVAIQRFLATQLTVGTSYQVAIHDFAPPSLPAAVITGYTPTPLPVSGAFYPKLQNNFQGTLGGQGGGGGGSGGGSGGGGGTGGGR